MKVVLSSDQAPTPTKVAYPETLSGCCDAVRRYVDTYQITEKDWSGGQVYLYGEYVGRISTNGKFFRKESRYAARPRRM